MLPPLTPGTAYAGIGSRETPAETLKLMRAIARMLAGNGMILRTGGAEGADSAFEAGAAGYYSQIFVPWPGFTRRLTVGAEVICVTDSPKFGEALAIAEKFHPNWSRCTQGARKLHARNVFQVLGPDLESPSAFIVCWTKNGKAAGGTGQALRIAEGYGVPVYNLQQVESLKLAAAQLGGSHGA